MPSKKKADLQAENVRITEEAFAKGAQLPVEPEKCGHINKQFMNGKGEQEDLVCTLPKGHAGEHFALFSHVVTDYGVDNDNRIIVKGSHTEFSEGWWSDAAGFLPQPVNVTPEEDFRRLKDARVRERSRNGLEMDEKLSNKVDGEVVKAFNG